ncbi:MAG: hypothetical protein R3279_01175 [Putridiphycobacter sp.]|nr:hypothetical protein [Putridiphycobacter sp.]
MKGKSHFTLTEAKAIEQLIEAKLLADTNAQKGIRRKIRNQGFFASDFGLRGGYTVADFRSVVIIDGKKPTVKGVPNTEKKRSTNKTQKSPSKESDETYIINLCDEVLQLKANRQHRFDFLRGDSGVKLPVDAYYPSLNLVIEYYERQHSEPVKFFDKKNTVSGMSRGEQRKLYDERRKVELPKNGIKLIVFDYTEFKHKSNKRLVRDKESDFKVILNKIGIYA